MVAQLARLLCIIALLWPYTALAGWPSASSSSVKSNTVNFNAVTDLGLVCDGVTNNQPAWATAGITVRANARVKAGAAVTVVFPPGQTCSFLSCGGPTQNQWIGLHDLTLIATGTTMNINGGCIGDFGSDSGFWGDVNANPPPFGMNQHVTHVGGGNVLAGDTCVQMSVAGTESNYIVGQWALLSGWGLQTSSFPPNYGFFDYLKIISINSSTHVICFNGAVGHDISLTWPDWAVGFNSCANVPCGGPPWLSGMNYIGAPAANTCQIYINNVPANGIRCNWDRTITIIGGTWFSNAQFHWLGVRNLRLENVTWTGTGTNSPYPSNSQNVAWINTNFGSALIEADKEVTNWTISGGNVGNIQLQSISVKNIDVINGAVIHSAGSPGTSMNCTNSTINGMSFGPTFGVTSLTFTGNNCNFPSGRIGWFASNGMQIYQGSVQTPWVYNGSGSFTCTGNHPGVVDCTDAQQWLQVGGHYQGGGHAEEGGWPFVVTDESPLTTCGGIVCQTVATTFNATIANLIPFLDGSGNFLYRADFARNWNCVNCTAIGGNVVATSDVADLNQAPAQGVPYLTYTKKTYTCQANKANVPGSLSVTDISNGAGGLSIVGNFVSQTVNVITPDTSSIGSTLLAPAYNTLYMDQVNYVTVNNNFDTINLKHAGIRTMTPGATSGAQAGDSMVTPPNVSWIDEGGLGNAAGTNPPGVIPSNYDALSTDPTKCAVWTIEVITTR